MAGKVALVTGAGSGIGEAAALVLAASGVKVAVLAHKLAEARSVVAKIEAAGGEGLALAADVAKAPALKAAIAAIARRWGALDIVVANAGINGVWAPVEEIALEEWERVVAVNLTGTFLTVKLCQPLLRKRGGAVTIVSSVNGTRMFSNAGASAYATTKAGQLAFGRMMALELAKHRIRVNTVCPGAIATEIGENTDRRHLRRAREPVLFPKGQIPLTDGKPGSATQVAQAIWFLSSPLASHVTGAEIFVDGAQSLLRG